MQQFFSNTDASVLIRLLIAHLLADFVFQSNTWVASKRKLQLMSPYLYLHVIVVTMLTGLLLWNLNLWWVTLATGATHLLIDAMKLKLATKTKPENELKVFAYDQIAHGVVIILLWLFATNSWIKTGLYLQFIFADYELQLKLLGYIVVASPAGFIIQFLTRRWINDLANNESLQNAGKWIGILERLLILTMVFIHQFGAIGFLLAAKSILRVYDKPDKPGGEPTMGKPFSSRKHTEYVLIGTLLSVGIAMAVGLIIENFLGSSNR